MGSIRALLCAAIFVVSAAESTKLPVFFFHGVTGNKTNAALIGANLTAEGRTYVALDFCQVVCSVQTALSVQVQMAIKQIRDIISKDASKFAGGYHFLSHSTGASIARGVIEEMDDHNVHSLISLAGDGNGNFYGPQASDATPLQVMLQLLGPFAFDASVFNFTRYEADSTTWRGVFQRDFTNLVMTKVDLQSDNSIANSLRPPLQGAALTNWLHINPFYPKVNNLENCGTNASCKADQIRRKNNFVRLKAAHFMASPQDDLQTPWQTSVLGLYSTVATIQEVATDFNNLKIIDMKQTEEYMQDLYGLKTLDTAGKLHLHVVPNVPHNCWLFDYTSLATNIPCKHDRVYDAQIYPYLV